MSGFGIRDSGMGFDIADSSSDVGEMERDVLLNRLALSRARFAYELAGKCIGCGFVLGLGHWSGCPLSPAASSPGDSKPQVTK